MLLVGCPQVVLPEESALAVQLIEAKREQVRCIVSFSTEQSSGTPGDTFLFIRSTAKHSTLI